MRRRVKKRLLNKVMCFFFVSNMFFSFLIFSITRKIKKFGGFLVSVFGFGIGIRINDK